MLFWINHLLSAFAYIAIGTPIYCICRYFYKRQKKVVTSFQHELFLYSFYAYLMAVFSQTIFISFPEIQELFYLKANINTAFFRVFNDAFRNINKGNYAFLVINIIGNIVAFIPLGLFLPMLQSKNKLFQCLFYSFLMSLSIELIQLIAYRVTDIDDLLLNTAGGVIGYLIYRFFIKERQNGV